MNFWKIYITPFFKVLYYFKIHTKTNYIKFIIKQKYSFVEDIINKRD